MGSHSGQTIPTALLIALGVLLSGCGTGAASSADIDAGQDVAGNPLPVETVAASRSEIFAIYHSTATIGSEADAPVTARAAGEVVEILVEEGDIVAAGQLLAILDGDRLRLEKDQARANLEKTRREYERYTSLHERGLVSSAAVEAMRFDLDSLQASFELKSLEYSYTRVRAPISGVISARDIKIGQHLNIGDTAFRVIDTSQLVAYLKIPQSELGKFSAGYPVQVQVDAIPGEKFAASISRISPTIDTRNGTFRATATIDNSDGSLTSGMFGRFSIAYEKHSDALVVPAAAILDLDGESVVYVVENGVAVRRPVRTGIESNGTIEVLSGIAEQELIVITGHAGLRDGSSVLASTATHFPVTG